MAHGIHDRGAGSPVAPAAAFDAHRVERGRADLDREGLAAGHRGSLSVVDYVKAVQRGEFHDVDASDVLVTPEDALVAKLALAMAAAIGESLAPSDWQLTKEAPAVVLAARTVQLSQPFSVEVGGIAQLFGADRDRRSLRVWTANAGGVLVAQDRYMAQSGQGALLAPNVVLSIDNYAGQLWVAGPTGTAAAFSVAGTATAGEVRNVPKLGSLRHDARGEESGAA